MPRGFRFARHSLDRPANPSPTHAQSKAVLENDGGIGVWQAQGFIHQYAQRHRFRSDLHGSRSQGIGGLPRVPPWHALVAPLTAADRNVEPPHPHTPHNLFLVLRSVEVEPVQVGLFFTLMHKRHRKKPTLITSNLGFREWRSFLKNDHLTAALIDRLTENSHLINMKNCVSLRPKLSAEA